MDYSLIQGTITSLKVASDLARGFLDLKSMTDVQAKVIELQSIILSAQSSALAANSEQASMAEEIRELKRRIAEVEAWGKEKERHALLSLEPGIYVYSLKEAEANGEPPHWVCAHCFNLGSKFLLQSQGDFYGATEHECPSCKTKIKVKSDVLPHF
jgi:rubrerythrin